MCRRHILEKASWKRTHSAASRVFHSARNQHKQDITLWGIKPLCSLCNSAKLMHPNILTNLTAWMLNYPANTTLAACLSRPVHSCFINQATARAFAESVRTKPVQWEVCSKGIRGDLCLISLRSLISKIISYTEQKELLDDLWVSQLLRVLGDATENSTS